SFQVAQKEATIKELESELKQVIDNSAVQEQLLFHVFQQNSEHFADLNVSLPAPFEESDHSRSSSSSRSASPVDSITSFFRESTVTSDRSRIRKARNVAATTEELLFSPDSRPTDKQYQQLNDIKSGAIYTQPAAPAILQEANGDLNNKSLSYVILPASDCDKFDKASHVCSGDAETTRISIFKPFIGGNEIQSSYLKCSHIAEGHKKAVLTVDCTEDVLFSGSEEHESFDVFRWTVKIGISTGTEIQNLDDHTSSVVKVCYCEYTRQRFTDHHLVKDGVRQRPSSGFVL
ncbi:kinesin-like protein KIF21A, partial [Stegodyphus dumicola]|uniref:kinesin-like protein KIF21A n=1 Tax=Stegodyphus dumicola TaxID=202533 RepID=UPI0015ABE9E1